MKLETLPLDQTELDVVAKLHKSSHDKFIQRILATFSILLLFGFLPRNLLSVIFDGAPERAGFFFKLGFVYSTILIVAGLLFAAFGLLSELNYFALKKDVETKQKLLITGTVQKGVRIKTKYFVTLNNSSIKGFHIPMQSMLNIRPGDEIKFEVFKYSNIFIRMLK